MQEKTQETVIENVEEVKETANEFVAQLVISVREDNSLDISTSPDGRKLETYEVEHLARRVYDELRDIRVANHAVEIFKQRLG